MDIVVKGRHTEVSDRFREHVREKLTRLERLDPKAFRLDVEHCHEVNRRRADACERIELTVYSRGPVIRAEASAGDKYAALDLALDKLEERLRRAADRRRARQHGQVHGHPHGLRTQAPLLDATSVNGEQPAPTATVPADEDAAPSAAEVDDEEIILAEGPLVVRQKVHEAEPITLDEALHHMELVGHDFYLFWCKETKLPSVVYRRRGYTYGVLRLVTQEATARQADTSGG